METGFERMDTNIYFCAAEKYMPTKIKFLLIAESPPAFKTKTPTAYFYFNNVPKADSLFYTLTKAFFDLDFIKSKYNRAEILNLFKNHGIFLIDSVSYPINKTKEWQNVDNFIRESIINKNKPHFNERINEFINSNYIDKKTNTILIKETVYNQHKNNTLLNIINKEFIPFPKYIKDRDVIESIRILL